MPHSTPDQLCEKILHGRVPLREAFETLPYGVIITDTQSTIVYYNPAQARIDSLTPEETLGKKTHRVYGPHPEPGLIATCLKTKKPVVNFVGLYRTYRGKVVNSTHTVVPLFEGRTLVGALCFIVELKSLVAAAPVSTVKNKPSAPNEVSFDTLVGQNLAFQRAIEVGRMTALSPSPILLAGETGCGKEMFARSIHEHSERAGRPFLAVNCAAIPEPLLEGLLFGTVKGAFTGALDRPGLFEEAHGGTLLLDELDSMPLDLQPKLLRVLQDKTARRVGGKRDFTFDLKIISSVSGPAERIIESGRVRPDLFYRLGVVVISLPPLRERLDDLPLLVDYFLMKYNYILGRRVRQADPEVLSAFLSYAWPGNVRELEHIIEAAMNLAGDNEMLTLDLLDHFRGRRASAAVPPPLIVGAAPPSPARYPAPPESNPAPAFPLNLEDAERQAITEALHRTGGNVTRAARLLGLSRQLLNHRLKRHGLTRERFLPG